MTSAKKQASADPRLARAQRLEEQAQGLRDEAEREFIANFPKIGDWLLVRYYYFNQNTRDREGVVTQAHPDRRTLWIEFYKWKTCDSCGQRTRKESTWINFDQILERLDGPTQPVPRVATRKGERT